MATPHDKVPHGLRRYRHRELKCRCVICKEAWNEYIRQYRKMMSYKYNMKARDKKKAKLLRTAPHVPPPPHGLKRYRNRFWRCRCTVCRAANAASVYDWRHKERKTT